jgi:hypothetical protein
LSFASRALAPGRAARATAPQNAISRFLARGTVLTRARGRKARRPSAPRGNERLAHVAEARQRTGKDQRNRYRISLGSAAEVGAALDVAVARGYISDVDAIDALALLDRVRAMTWRLSR